MANETQSKLLKAARSLMLSKGYPATTVDEICEAAGLTKGSFYHYFKTKEELGLAAVEDYYQEGTPKLFHGPFESITDPVERALAYIDHVELMAKELWANGCLLGNLVMDLADTNPRIRAKVAELFDDVTSRFARLLAPLSQRGSKGAAPSSTELAEHLLSVIEGSIVLGRAHGDWGHVVQGLRQFKRYVKALAT